MQSGSINSLPGVDAAKLFAIGSDTVAATASSVTPGTNDPTLYAIVFSGVATGEYRLVLLDGSEIAESGIVVTVTASGWTVKDCCDTPDDSGSESPTVSTSVESAMGNPREASADGVTVKSHSLPELIAAEKYIAAKAAAAKPHRGLRFSRIVPGSTTD